MTKQLIIGDARHELATTRRILELLPEEHMSWRPHAKSMTLSGLASHIINLLGLQICIFFPLNSILRLCRFNRQRWPHAKTC